MRALAMSLLVAVSACAAETHAPSLAPRPAEAIDPRVPVVEPPVATTPAPALVRQLDSLVAQAIDGDTMFKPIADRAAQLAEVAGGEGSESWIAAQQALSAAVTARTPVTSAVGDIDALGSNRIQRLGGIGAADLKAIKAAAARVQEIDEREAATITRLQARINR